MEWSRLIIALGTPPGAPFFLSRRMRVPNFRLLTALLLPLRGLPAAHQIPARRVQAILLIPSPGLIDIVATAAQAASPA